MRPAFIDWPRQAELSEYAACEGRLLERLGKIPGLSAVYRVGSVSEPGISDIDLLALFRDDAVCAEDPRDALEPGQRGLVSHSLHAAGEWMTGGLLRYCWFDNVERLTGSDPIGDAGGDGFSADGGLRRQVALEYLLRMYVSLSIQRATGIYKVRSLLLQARAMRYDLDLLGVPSGPLRDDVAKVAAWRKGWFSAPPSKREIGAWVDGFHGRLEGELAALLDDGAMLVPPGANLHFPGNIHFVEGEALKYCRRGPKPPKVFAFLGRRYFNFMNRFSTHTFDLPLAEAPAKTAAADRFGFLWEAGLFLRKHFPRFTLYGAPFDFF